MNSSVFSTSDLIKRSASQILYLLNHPKDRGVSDLKRKGVEHQEAMSTSGSFREMRGTFAMKDVTLHFCWDEVIVSAKRHLAFHEIKQPGSETWYYDNSVLQTAVYAALTEQSFELVTATFHTRATGEKQTLDITLQQKDYYLLFGDRKIKVTVKKRLPLILYYVDKAKMIHRAAVDKDWSLVKRYDEEYKFKDVEMLHKFYETKEIL
jgi:hypothetical protein